MLAQERRPTDFKSMLEAALRGDLGPAPSSRTWRGNAGSALSTGSGYSDLGASASVVAEAFRAGAASQAESPTQWPLRVSAPEPEPQRPGHAEGAGSASAHPRVAGASGSFDGRDAGASGSLDGRDAEGPGDGGAAAAADEEGHHVAAQAHDNPEESNAEPLAHSQLPGIATSILYSDDEQDI